MKNGKKKVVIGISFEPEQLDWLREMSERTGVPISHYIGVALAEKIERETQDAK
jgi:hypothetical protein